jgi:hypothetical protein
MELIGGEERESCSSVAAIVAGGTRISGGSAAAVGIFLASALPILVVTTMQIVSLPPRTQDLAVMLVLPVATRKPVQKRKTGDAGADETPVPPGAAFSAMERRCG